MGSGESKLGDRPFFYKQGPGDAPSDVQTKAGVVVKREDISAAPAVAKPAPTRQEIPQAPAPVVERRPLPPTIAQAAPRAPSTASGSAAGDFLGRYTQATPYGDMLFVSGQIAIDLRSGSFDDGQDVEAQTRRVLENIRAILESNRLTMANVVLTTVYLANINNLSAMDRVYHGFFKGVPPARTVVEVTHLPRGALVEISVIAGR